MTYKLVDPAYALHASHLCVLAAGLELFGKDKGLEHGCGLHSTPTFWESDLTSFTAVDEHSRWVARMKEELPDKDGFVIKLRPNVVRHAVQTGYYVMKAKQRHKVWDDAYQVLQEEGPIDLLFVDGGATSRFAFLDVFFPWTRRFAAWHDSNDPQSYGYEGIELPEACTHYRFSPNKCYTDFILIKDSRRQEEAFLERMEEIYHEITGLKDFPLEKLETSF